MIDVWLYVIAFLLLTLAIILGGIYEQFKRLNENLAMPLAPRRDVQAQTKEMYTNANPKR